MQSNPLIPPLMGLAKNDGIWSPINLFRTWKMVAVWEGCCWGLDCSVLDSIFCILEYVCVQRYLLLKPAFFEQLELETVLPLPQILSEKYSNDHDCSYNKVQTLTFNMNQNYFLIIYCSIVLFPWFKLRTSQRNARMWATLCTIIWVFLIYIVRWNSNCIQCYLFSSFLWSLTFYYCYYCSNQLMSFIASRI